MNKLTTEQNEHLNELETILKSFLYDIDYLRENGESEIMDIGSLLDDISDSIKELNKSY